MEHLYRKAGFGVEHCFNVETTQPLSGEEFRILKWILAETFQSNGFATQPFLSAGPSKVAEVGPRLNFATAYSTNAVSICHACGLTQVTRLERSRRFLLPVDIGRAEFVAGLHDRMTECEYPKPLETFETGIQPEPVFIIPLIEEGPDALRRINKKMGLGMDEWDINFYTDLFIQYFKRNPTNVECFQLGQANSEHSRHWFFRGRIVIDGVEMPRTLFEVVKSTLKANPNNSIIAFKDNSSGIRGYDIWTILPERPGQCSCFGEQQLTYHIIFTAETHNFPSGVAPFPGAETGAGGRIRDVHATGRGSLMIAGTAGFCVGNLNITDYQIPGEDNSCWPRPGNLESPLTILLRESAGAWDYGNKIGEPVIAGFTRTFGQILPNGERREWLKPIMFTGGIGQIDSRHIQKAEPQKGMLIVQIGGPAYRIGMGGGAASSMISGDNVAELDFNAVQRGDAEMENKENRVIRACVEMGERNPILSVHDQGAGGPCNVLTEILLPAGGKILLRRIKVGDKTMATIEIWGAEYQERDAFLIWPDRIEEFKAICQREKVNCEVLGEITGDGRIVVYDEQDGSTPVDLELSRILGDMPQKTFETEEIPKQLTPLELQFGFNFDQLISKVFTLPSVGSKEGLLYRVDRSVTGLIAQQQFCGPLHLPVADVAVVAQSHFGLTGAATAIGEQPIKMLVNERAGARMAVGEMLTNIASARISDLTDIKCSANWMWAAKLAGEGAALYFAALAMEELMLAIGIAVDGGKDSLSMAAKVGAETVKAPGQLVISGYCTMPDITKVMTPDIKHPGQSQLMLLDLGGGKNRLGGSALAQAFGQIGDVSPDVDDPSRLVAGFRAIQQLIDLGLITAIHDRSDGGLITTVLEMAFAGNCGLLLNFDQSVFGSDPLPVLFNEELGWVIEFLSEKLQEIQSILLEAGLNQYCQVIGTTCDYDNTTVRVQFAEAEFIYPMAKLRAAWRETSFQLDALQSDSQTVSDERRNTFCRPGPTYQLTFRPTSTLDRFLVNRPKVGILREEGTNGDREMTSAFYQAGFEVWDITMTDLIEGHASLQSFKGIVFPGGFSYADVLDAGKGWAAVFRFNSRLQDELAGFVVRQDTFILGVCNGCQVMALLGVIPWVGISDQEQPRFIRNDSQAFESRWVTVTIKPSNSIFLWEMEGSTLGIWVAHGEGRAYFPSETVLDQMLAQMLAPIRFVDDEGKPTESYPFNPNGSRFGITGITSQDGRFLAMMPHPERIFLPWQWPYWPKDWQSLSFSPWLKLFQNARAWCDTN